MLDNKPNILVFIDWFHPGYLAGGPVQSIVSLVQNLSSYFNFKIVTGNTDLDNKPYPNIPTNTWINSDLGCKVFYFDRQNINAARIKDLINTTDFDAVYINSFFSKFFSIVPLSLLNKVQEPRRIIFAPRGMLGAGALKIKWVKKSLFILYSRLSGMHKNVVWHATSTQEAEEIKLRFGSAAKIEILSNLPKSISTSKMKNKRAGQVNICFISRISEKKNLSFAFEILKLCKSKINFSIFGPIEDLQYWKHCQSIATTLGDNVTWQYKGVIAPEEVQPAFENQHILLLPTLNENFGHSIVESLLCGTPVIISDQTPWVDVAENHAGFAIPLSDIAAYVQSIEFFAELNQEKFMAYSVGARTYIDKKLNLNNIVAQYKTLFNDSIKN